MVEYSVFFGDWGSLGIDSNCIEDLFESDFFFPNTIWVFSSSNKFSAFSSMSMNYAVTSSSSMIRGTSVTVSIISGTIVAVDFYSSCNACYFIFSAFLSFHLMMYWRRYWAPIILLLSITSTVSPSTNLSMLWMWGASAFVLLSFIIFSLYISSDPYLSAFCSIRSTTVLKSAVFISRNISYCTISSFLKAYESSRITSHFDNIIPAFLP